MVYPVVKTMKWIRIKEKPAMKGMKTKMFFVDSIHDNSCLGMIKWHPAWRIYCFFPAEGSFFEWDCLRDIADFCQQETKRYRKNWHRKRG
jgi:hypothetical protein